MPTDTFAQRLRTIMDKIGIRQSELSLETGIPKSAISQYLSGAFTPKRDRVTLIADKLGIPEAWLMGYDIEPEEKNSPGETQLTEGEKKLLELFRLIPEEKKQMVLDMIRAALKSK